MRLKAIIEYIKMKLKLIAILYIYNNSYSSRSSSASLSSASGKWPQSRKQSRYLTVDGDSLFRFLVIISLPLLNTRSDAADVAGIAR
jgi:hypothetical protein